MSNLEELPSFDPEHESQVDRAYAAYEAAQNDLRGLNVVRETVEARRRDDIAAATYPMPSPTQAPQQQSSVEIEDMTKEPFIKVTTKLYIGSPLTTADLDAALDAHGYAHRLAAEMILTKWQKTVDMLKGAGE